MSLNNMSDDGAKDLAKYFVQSLIKTPEGSSAYRAHMNLGLLAWRENNDELMKQHLSTAAERVVGLFERRDLSATDKIHSPQDFEFPFMFTILFGNADLRKRIALLPRPAWYQPEAPEYKPLVKLFELVQNYLLDASIDTKDISPILFDNLTPESHSFYYPWVNAMCEGLQAVQDKNIEKVTQAIETLLALHQEEAVAGDWQYIPEGLVAIWALVLWKIANELDIKVEIESAYLPVNAVL